MAQLVKNPPAVREIWVRSLGWEDLLEKERLPSPVFWPGEFHGLYSSWGRKESDTTERLFTSLHFPSLLSELSLPRFPQDPAQATLGGFILLAALRAGCAVFTALP